MGGNGVSALSRIVGAIGTVDFMTAAASSIAQAIGFDQATFFLHGTGDGAVLLFANFSGSQDRLGLQNYASHTYRLNPMLARNTGMFRARDFFCRDTEIEKSARHYVVRSPKEELGFRTLGWPEKLEEVGLYLRSCGGIIELSFYRERSRGRRRRLDDIRELSAPLAAAFERHMALTQISDATSFFPAGLSSREKQVVGLILQGHTSEAIGRRLDISLHTVKDHRKQVFRKLGVSSMGELFILERNIKMRLAGSRLGDPPLRRD